VKTDRRGGIIFLDYGLEYRISFDRLGIHITVVGYHASSIIDRVILLLGGSNEERKDLEGAVRYLLCHWNDHRTGLSSS
jgi:hypothetical protein